MSNWFKKKSQYTDDDPRFQEQPLKPVRYRVMIPVDIWATPTGDQLQDEESVYNLLKGILNAGSQAVDHQGFDDYLELNDIKTHESVMKDFGL